MIRSLIAPFALTAALGAMASAGPAAALTTFFAQDSGLPPTATAAERALFEAALDITEHFDFEVVATGMAAGAANGQTGFASGGTALSFFGDGEIRDADTPEAQYAVTPVQYLRVKSGDAVAISFGGAGVNAFGYYGSDIGDFDGELGLRLLDFFGGVQEDLGTFATSGANGNLVFSGVIAADDFFGVEFYVLDPTGDSDAFGIDDFVLGAAPTPATIPLPGAGLLLLSGLAGLAGLRRLPRRPA